MKFTTQHLFTSCMEEFVFKTLMPEFSILIPMAYKVCSRERCCMSRDIKRQGVEFRPRGPRLWVYTRLAQLARTLLSSQCGTHITVKVTCWPCLYVKSTREVLKLFPFRSAAKRELVKG